MNEAIPTSALPVSALRKMYLLPFETISFSTPEQGFTLPEEVLAALRTRLFPTDSSKKWEDRYFASGMEVRTFLHVESIGAIRTYVIHLSNDAVRASHTASGGGDISSNPQTVVFVDIAETAGKSDMKGHRAGYGSMVIEPDGEGAKRAHVDWIDTEKEFRSGNQHPHLALPRLILMSRIAEEITGKPLVSGDLVTGLDESGRLAMVHIWEELVSANLAKKTSSEPVVFEFRSTREAQDLIQIV